MEKKIPMRMCVCCRQMKPKKSRLRIVKSGEEISIDFTGKKNGRGAYICDDAECVKKLRKQKVLNKVFSANVGDEVYASIEENFFDKKQG